MPMTFQYRQNINNYGQSCFLAFDIITKKSLTIVRLQKSAFTLALELSVLYYDYLICHDTFLESSGGAVFD